MATTGRGVSSTSLGLIQTGMCPTRETERPIQECGQVRKRLSGRFSNGVAQMSGQSITANKQVQAAGGTAFGVILAISFCHLLNDMMHALLPSIYPNLQAELRHTDGQIVV